MRKRIVSLLPVILVMIIIFHFSAANAGESSALSYSWSMRLLRWYQKIFHTVLSQGQQLSIAQVIEVPLRKLAHFAEYGLLGITVMVHLFVRVQQGMQGKKRYGMIFCALYAVSDEIHQYFVPGRACLLKDVIIDSAGAVTGILLTSWILYQIFQKIKGRDLTMHV